MLQVSDRRVSLHVKGTTRKKCQRKLQDKVRQARKTAHETWRAGNEDDFLRDAKTDAGLSCCLSHTHEKILRVRERVLCGVLFALTAYYKGIDTACKRKLNVKKNNQLWTVLVPARKTPSCRMII